MTVTVSAVEVAAFVRTWPCANFPEDEPIMFAFGTNGDLVDIIPSDWEERGADGYAVACLSRDAQAGLIGTQS
jgi:hypothetical protein